MKYILNIVSLSLLSIITIAAQTSYAECLSVGSISCYGKDYSDEDAMLRVGGLLKHQDKSVETINLLCPITSHGVTQQHVESMSVYLKDKLAHPIDSAWGEGYDKNNIIVRLRNVDSYDGDINTIWNVYSATGNRSKIGSHEWGTQGYYKVTTIRGSNYPVMNFNDQFYYLDVTIKRDSVSDTPVFSGVSICGTAVRDR